MRTIKCKLNTGFVGAVHIDEIEVEDDATDEDIDSQVWDALVQYLDVSWEEISQKQRNEE